MAAANGSCRTSRRRRDAKAPRSIKDERIGRGKSPAISFGDNDQIAQVDGDSPGGSENIGIESGNSVGWLALRTGDMSPDPRDEIAETVQYDCMTSNEAEAKLKDLGSHRSRPSQWR